MDVLCAVRPDLLNSLLNGGKNIANIIAPFAIFTVSHNAISQPKYIVGPVIIDKGKISKVLYRYSQRPQLRKSSTPISEATTIESAEIDSAIARIMWDSK